MNCAKCHAVNAPGRRFCSRCGAALAAVCSSCGFENGPEDRFCGGCGRPVAGSAEAGALARIEAGTAGRIGGRLEQAPAAMDGQIKIVTVLFADIRGSTAMIAGL